MESIPPGLNLVAQSSPRVVEIAKLSLAFPRGNCARGKPKHITNPAAAAAPGPALQSKQLSRSSVSQLIRQSIRQFHSYSQSIN